MSDDDDPWVKMAMADDSHVAHLLLRLRQSLPPPPPPPPSNKHASLCLQLHWTVRQPRSRPAAAAHKKADPTRASPTTPLSWSAATSASGGAAVDGHEESSRPIKPVDTSRSKGGDQSETAPAKRSRRKRTLAELKEEENLLLKESRDLKNELAALHLTVEKHRARNENLKRMKLEYLVSPQTFKIAATSLVSGKAVVDPPQLVEAHCHPSKSVSLSPQTVKDKVLDDESPVCAASASSKQEISKQEASFTLPDLNLPAEKDFNSNVIPGIS